MTGAVKKTFANRPHPVEQTPGFVRLDVLLRTVIDNLPDYVYVKHIQSRFVAGN